MEKLRLRPARALPSARHDRPATPELAARGGGRWVGVLGASRSWGSAGESGSVSASSAARRLPRARDDRARGERTRAGGRARAIASGVTSRESVRGLRLRRRECWRQREQALREVLSFGGRPEEALGGRRRRRKWRIDFGRGGRWDLRPSVRRGHWALALGHGVTSLSSLKARR